MKHTLLKSFSVLAASALVLGSCQKLEDFGDTNVNPFGSPTPITAALLTNAERTLATGGNAAIGGTGTGGVRAGLYVQYFSETQYTDVSLYAEPKLDFGGIYAGPLEDLQQIIDRNTNDATKASVAAYGSNNSQIAIATILKTYYMWTVTDRWGDVPYTEALQGAGNYTPSYDKQQDIYTKMLTELKNAVAKFDGGPAVQGDIIYGGDEAKWKKLANSLRMMIALRMSKVYPAPGGFAATEFAAADADPNGSIATNADNVVIAFPGGSFKAPWYNIYDGRSDYAYSKTLADILNNMGDGRKAAFGAATGAPFPYGLKREDATTLPTSYARVLDATNRGEAAPVVIVNAASVLLARSEAVARGWITAAHGTAKELYDAGVTASFAQWNVSGAATVLAGSANFNTGAGGGVNIGSNSFNSVVGQDALTPDTTPAPLKRIALQRYLAHYPDGIQGWSEWRRSCAPGTPSPATNPAGTPRLAPTVYATNSGAGIPRRFVYGTSEYSLNPAKVAEAVARLTGGDKVTSRMWWDL